MPACVAEAEVGVNTSAVDAVGVADGSHAVYARPPLKALATLPIVFVVVKEAPVKEFYATSFHQLRGLDQRVVQNVTQYFIGACF